MPRVPRKAPSKKATAPGKSLQTKAKAASKKPGGRPVVPVDEIVEVMETLLQIYGTFKTELTYRNPWELMVAVALSAQCTDARVNLTTPSLFARFSSPEALAAADPQEVEKLIHACGFFRMKAKAIMKASADLVNHFGGEVPSTMDELVTLAGVGRKTASVILNQAFDLPAIAVDTHVARVSHRLGWTRNTDPVKIESDLCALIPQKHWAAVNGLLILHGRRICKARKPLCPECPVSHRCELARSSGLAKKTAR